MRSNRAAVLIGLAALVLGTACGGSSSNDNPTTKQFKLTVTKDGAQKDNGTITSTPAGITCGTTCSLTVDEGTAVTLTAATTAASAAFAGFSGDCTATATTCVVTVSADKTVKATFNVAQVNLRVFAWGGGATTPAAGIHAYDYGTTVTVTAAAGTGATFTGWSDGTSQATTTVTLNGDKMIGARFYNPATASDTWTLPVPASVPAATSTLKVLDWAGFKAAVSYTFDDARVSQAEGATPQDVGANYQLMADTGTPMTFFISPNQVERHLQFWKDVAADGQEIANHTEDHCQVHTDGTLVLPPLASGEQGCAYTYGVSETTQNAMDEIDAANAYIKEKLGQDVFTMASPYGDAKWAPFAQAAGMIMMRNVWSTGNTDHNYVPPLDVTNQFNVPGVWFGPVEEFDYSKDPPTSQGQWGELGNSTEVINKVIDDVRTAGGWSTFLIHRLTPSTYDAADGCCEVPVASLVASMNHIKNDAPDVWAGRVVDVAAYWIGQKLVKEAAVSTTGGGTTYSWTLPANFPPGKFVRVTIDGAVLSQRGHDLVKAAGGYYEVALDAGELTVTYPCLLIAGTTASNNLAVQWDLVPPTGKTVVDFSGKTYTASFDLYVDPGSAMPMAHNSGDNTDYQVIQMQFPNAAYSPMYVNNYGPFTAGTWKTVTIPLNAVAYGSLLTDSTKARIVFPTVNASAAVSFCVKNLVVTDGTNKVLDFQPKEGWDYSWLYTAAGTTTSKAGVRR